MSKYLGLSGHKGRRRSCKTAGITEMPESIQSNSLVEKWVCNINADGKSKNNLNKIVVHACISYIFFTLFTYASFGILVYYTS